ncbi:hypothetical protein AX16_005550 [Volvariella volvacea WC 439]|nr:hypothetical protein AX16_005550 [Volvariella volvacea WC 439]
MPAEPTTTSGSGPPEPQQKSRPTTRASLRSTLNLASVGKAFADAISKDGKDSIKGAKKAKDTKETSSRRNSAILLKSTAPRHSGGEGTKSSVATSQATNTSTSLVSPPSAAPAPTPATASASAPSNAGSTRSGTPESKTITTRRRLSATIQPRASTDDPAPRPSESNIPVQQSAAHPPPRIATLRPRAANGASAVPKYRPKSQIMAPNAVAAPAPAPAQAPSPTPPTKANSPTPTKVATKTTSPSRSGTRRSTISSEEDKEDRPVEEGCGTIQKKKPRPISPLSQRTALKAVGNSPRTPTTPASKIKAPATSPQSSPTRPTATPQPNARPSSSSSSSSPPRTPRTPSVRSSISSRPGSGQLGGHSVSPTNRFPAINVRTESPLAPYSRRASKQNTSSSSSASSSFGHEMTRINEVNSESEDEEQVRMLLEPESGSSVSSTPAIPRVTRTRSKRDSYPQTPMRNLLPTRANLSYLSPDVDQPPSLRPTALTRSGERAARGSILSWEQLAQEASKTLGDDADIVLSEVAAPFRSGAVSPSLSAIHLEIPESPCLSTLSSPSGYGSISQVLLPEVTPSPAFHPSTQSRYDEAAQSSGPAVDGAIVTLLKLQLASAENMAKERLYQMQTMEEELHRLKEARTREVQEMTQQVAIMEEQVKQHLEARIKATEERAAYTASLEDQLQHAQAYKEEAIKEAVKHAKIETQGVCEQNLKRQQWRWELTYTTRMACSGWEAVKQQSENELELVRADKEVLTVFMNELNHLQATMLPQ